MYIIVIYLSEKHKPFLKDNSLIFYKGNRSDCPYATVPQVRHASGKSGCAVIAVLPAQPAACYLVSYRPRPLRGRGR